ncbi:vitellogenin receptor Yl-like [Planococcus citri]|uniref:vitellogenin receptor Yl-like n=1 Tax=Planococcus citri TaxID=170843 RepID=UPI0031F8B786
MEFLSLILCPFLFANMVCSLENDTKFSQVQRLRFERRQGIRSEFPSCTYQEGQFLCKDRMKCIDLKDTCDGECHCWDCSDENELCWKYDEFKCRTCTHSCLTTPSGPQCFCNASIPESESSSICKEIEECGKDATCQHRCVKYQGIERCSCGENYKSKPHTLGRSCLTYVAYENVLIYSTERDIKSFNLATNRTSLIQKNVECKGLSAAHTYILYGVADKKTGYVYKTTVASGASSRVFETHSPIIFSIDVDWLTGNIYFSTDKALGVCSKDGKLCALIKTLSFTDSCHIALAPRYGLLFHSLRALHNQYEDSRIIKSSMDGSDETDLVHEGLRHPMSLTVDESSQRVYWMDCDLGEIESIQFNGMNRKIWYSESQKNIFTMSTFEGNVFWTEEKKNIIYMNFEDNPKFITDLDASSVKYLNAFNPKVQQTKIPNPCKKASCKGMCLLRPSSSSPQLNYTCLCDNVDLSSTKYWCNNHSAQVEWQHDQPEYEGLPLEVPPEEKTKGTSTFALVLEFIVLIILGTGLGYFMYRNRILQRYYDRVRNWGRQQYDELNTNEYVAM